MEQLIGVLGILVVFGAIVAIHEFGHFICAKLSKMGVYEFSLGFGPAIFKRESNGTLYAVRIIPLGGYVRIAGMEVGEEDRPDGYDKKSFFAKFATLIAGATMNFVLAFFLFIIVGMTVGYGLIVNKPIIGDVQPDSPAAHAQLQAGDRMVSINGTTVSSWDEVTKILHANRAEVTMVIERDHARQTVKIVPKEMLDYKLHGLRLRPVKYYGIGIMASVTLQRVGPLQSVVLGSQQVYDKTKLVLASIVSMITRDVSAKDISGPVAVMRISYDASKDALISREKMANFLSLFAFLSINIGFFNLLPIPALDGGRLLFLIAEKIYGKPFDRDKEAMVHMVGMALLLGLILLVTVKDILGWIGGR